MPIKCDLYRKEVRGFVGCQEMFSSEIFLLKDLPSMLSVRCIVTPFRENILN